MNDAKHALAFLVVGVAMWVVSGMEGVTGASVARVLWLQIMGVLQACIGAGRMAEAREELSAALVGPGKVSSNSEVGQLRKELGL